MVTDKSAPVAVSVPTAVEWRDASDTVSQHVVVSHELATEMLVAFRAVREWVQAVPQGTVLPAMPGCDGDWLDTVESTFAAALNSRYAPAAEVKESAPLDTRGTTAKAAFLMDKSLPAGTLLYAPAVEPLAD